MGIEKHKDFWSGVMFIAFGAFFALLGLQYKFGTAAQMGPAYFPMVLSIILIMLGVAILLSSFFSKGIEKTLDGLNWGKLLLILCSVLLFSLLLKPLGLVLSLFVLIVVSSCASYEFKLMSSIINALVIIALCLSIFVWALNLPLPLWPVLVGK